VSSNLSENLGTRRPVDLPKANFPNADSIVRKRREERLLESKVDILLVNPPAPDGGIWIRSQHRVGRRSRENMIWPQVSLAQMAALLYPDYSIEIIDAIARRMTWKEFEKILQDRRPKYYVTQCTAPSLTNDMYGVFLAKSMGAVTMVFGTHVTPLPGETLSAYPALDFVLRGEPELTLRETIDTFEVARGRWNSDASGKLTDLRSKAESKIHSDFMWKMWVDSDPNWKPAWLMNREPGLDVKNQSNQIPAYILPDTWPEVVQLEAIHGLVWRKAGKVTINQDRNFIKDLNDLPIPFHHLLPLKKYRMPMIRGPYTFLVSSRGCPAGCKFCIKHVSYQYSVRLRSAEKMLEEIKILYGLGVHHIHMYADTFTVSRDQVVEFCNLLLKENLKITWTCNSRVDYVDEEELQLMGKSGCILISWGIESKSELILKSVHKGYRKEQVLKALSWAKKAGIKNWGYFIIGLPGETEETIKDSIQYSKELPLDILLFHVAAPYPGTPFFFEVVENNWFRHNTNWEEVDMDQATVLDYSNMKAEDLLYWQRRAFREWSLRPGPIWTMIKSMNTWEGFKSAINIGLQTLGWIRS
jgi:anaerobic magnesium-protoporphyrin IX monomethyl ester cyclase